MDAAALIPIKAFSEAKARLSGALAPAERQCLARWTAARVVRAADGLPVFVACDDDEVAAWSVTHGATVLWQAGKGLNNAVDDAVADLARQGCLHVVVAHADLARPTSLAKIVRAGTITLVPDQRDDGTNVMSFPTACDMRVAYGAGSFHRHLALALSIRANGAPPAIMVEIRRDVMLSLDIDTPADLLHPLVKEVLPAWLPTNPANPTSHDQR